MVRPKRPHIKQVEVTRTAFIQLAGGEDQVTPALGIDPGALRFSLNYEPGQAYGYRRVDGFERFDGQGKPSEASYWILRFSAGDNEPSIGRTVIGATSGATGELLAVVVESGAWATNDAAGYLVITGMSGAFVQGESINYSQPEAFSSGFSGGFQ